MKKTRNHRGLLQMFGGPSPLARTSPTADVPRASRPAGGSLFGARATRIARVAEDPVAEEAPASSGGGGGEEPAAEEEGGGGGGGGGAPAEEPEVVPAAE